MLDKLQEFVSLLRKNGVTVGTSEFLDALRALELVGLCDPHVVKEALRACLCKRPADDSRFEDLFSLFFHREGDLLLHDEGNEPPLVTALRQAGLTDEQIEKVIAELMTQAARLDPTARLGLGLRRAGLSLLLRLSGQTIDVSRMQSPLQIGFFTQGLLDELGFRRAETELRALLADLAPTLGEHVAQTVLKQAEQNLWQFRGAVRNEVQKAFEKQNLRFADTQRSLLLSEKPLARLSAAELSELRKEVIRLADKLKNQKKEKPRRKPHGRLDMRRTLRAAVQTGGVPFRLFFRVRKPHKPRLVLLCDISDSVRQVARFALQFVWAVQERFSKVRSFVFVSDVGDATDLFRNSDPDRAIEKAYSGAVVRVSANSNYGQAFQQFVARHLTAVTTRTTVIILGDGRSNYFPSHASALAQIKARAKQVLWLNPEQPSSWVFGDSAMRDYLPHVSRAEVVHNLASLRRVIDQLII